MHVNGDGVDDVVACCFFVVFFFDDGGGGGDGELLVLVGMFFSLYSPVIPQRKKSN